MKAEPSVTLFGYCTLPHASQIYTGLHVLNRKKIISLRFDSENKIQNLFNVTPTPSVMGSGVFAIIDGETVFFDFLDSTEAIIVLSQKIKHYLKRSFVHTIHSKHNIKPLGLNYEVYNKNPNTEEMIRILKLNFDWKSTTRQKIGTLADATGLGFLPRTTCFDKTWNAQSKSIYDVLFIARTWDPHEPQISLSEAEKEDRFQINNNRAALIRTLKNELGKRFLGGLSSTPHAKKEFPDLVLDNPIITKKKNYLQIVPTIPICIATTGLHGSIGWKFAEYVALGRAIVTEETNIFVPHQFEESKNYLSFHKNESCLANIELLLKNKGYRENMMKNNKAYYNQHLQPEMFALDAIATIKAL